MSKFSNRFEYELFIICNVYFFNIIIYAIFCCFMMRSDSSYHLPTPGIDVNFCTSFHAFSYEYLIQNQNTLSITYHIVNKKLQQSADQEVENDSRSFRCAQRYTS